MIIFTVIWISLVIIFHNPDLREIQNSNNLLCPIVESVLATAHSSSCLGSKLNDFFKEHVYSCQRSSHQNCFISNLYHFLVQFSGWWKILCFDFSLNAVFAVEISQIEEGESNQVLHNSDLCNFGPDSMYNVQCIFTQQVYLVCIFTKDIS